MGFAMARPKKIIDYVLAEKLAYIQCTVSEIANMMGVARETLERDKAFRHIHEKGMENGRSSLRRLQWKAAEAGDKTMLIWLGKQYLAQKDKSEVTGKDGQPIVQPQIVVVSQESRTLTERVLKGERTAIGAQN
jgi:hypothetical protein